MNVAIRDFDEHSDTTPIWEGDNVRVVQLTRETAKLVRMIGDYERGQIEIYVDRPIKIVVEDKGQEVWLREGDGVICV